MQEWLEGPCHGSPLLFPNRLPSQSPTQPFTYSANHLQNQSANLFDQPCHSFERKGATQLSVRQLCKLNRIQLNSGPLSFLHISLPALLAQPMPWARSSHVVSVLVADWLELLYASVRHSSVTFQLKKYLERLKSKIRKCEIISAMRSRKHLFGRG